jgi:hypothetical protein
MPRSKHKRKAGGKSVRTPGRSPARQRRSITVADISNRYFAVYLDAFYQQAHPECDYADELLDIVSYATFDIRMGRFHSVSKADLFQTFVDPVELPDGSQHVRTLEEAEAALQYLAEREMVVVDGDVVSAHPRFAYLANTHERASSPVL